MQHFIAIIWDDLDPTARAQASALNSRLKSATADWRVMVESRGLTVAIRPNGRHECLLVPLQGGAGAIVGTLFHAGRIPKRVQGLDFQSTSAIIRSQCAYLIHEYWGNYVALVRDESNAGVQVVRDCSGQVPCFTIVVGAVSVVFSCLQDLEPLRLPKLQVDLDYLTAFVLDPDLQSQKCAFKEVREVLAGECLTIASYATKQYPIWDPGKVAHHSETFTIAAAGEALRATTESCIQAWSSCFDRILVSLSGGLDSAIVLGCLHRLQVDAHVECYTVVSRLPGEDESRFAKIAAQAAGVSLREIDRASLDSRWDQRLLDFPFPAKPQIQLLTGIQERERIERVTHSHHTDSIWTGQGGDHLFWQDHSHLAASDYFLMRGFGLGLARAVADSAHLSKKSFASVIRSIWNVARARPLRTQPNLRNRLVNMDAIPANLDSYIDLPWAESVIGLPPGKQDQISLLADLLNRHRPFPGLHRGYQHHPLLSQPLIELCSRIPTYCLLHGGRSRGLARMAFKTHLPTEIINREDKGSVTSSAVRQIRENKQFVANLLMDGILAREHIINRNAVERYIVRDEPMIEEDLRPLLACIATEVWYGSWERKQNTGRPDDVQASSAMTNS